MAIRRKGESITAFRKRKERIKEQAKKNKNRPGIKAKKSVVKLTVQEMARRRREKLKKAKLADKKPLTGTKVRMMEPPKEMSAKDKKKVKDKTFLNIAAGPKPKNVTKEDLKKIDKDRKKKKTETVAQRNRRLRMERNRRRKNKR
jgi:hypothetical protein